jgi:23S rRNA (cytidine1920-2'-O)/16S rRNA (cytidine1409-2'-O)-methyltransferase
LFPLITVDVSFISLTKIIPALSKLLTTAGQLITLIKPQFEVGPQEVGRKGIVREAAKHQRVIQEVAQASCAVGLTPVGVIASPVLGADGNQEFLALFNRQFPSLATISEDFALAIQRATRPTLVSTNFSPASNV